MQNIELKLSVEETNLILEALGAMPFSKVYALIAKIQEQANQQLNSGSQTNEGKEPKQSVQTED